MSVPVNLPEVVAAVREAFAAYEQALVTNDVAMLDLLFHDSVHTLRYGATENLLGSDAIRAFRAARPAVGLARDIFKTVITSYGTDFATANTEFQRHGSERTGRQSHTWVRFPTAEVGEAFGGWRIVAAHVSLLA